MTAAIPTGVWPDAVLGGAQPARLKVVGSQEVIPLPVRRWHGSLTVDERLVINAARPPVLDIGCGPGRHATALDRLGRRSLGIDTSPAAIRAARRRGATAIQVSVFGPVPDPGRWATALLFDGNIGIGGDPIRLLERVRDLLNPTGTLLVEVEPPERGSRRFHAQVQHADQLSPGFPWACVGAGEIESIGESAGLVTNRVWRGGHRWFAELSKDRP